MDAICSRCGADLPAGARFCPRCGASSETPVSAERRVVTVVFADLADSTALASELDPERFREIQAAFYRAASESVEALRGRVEKFIGDAIMAVFGLPGSHEDDALRAVRSAIEIRDRVERLGEGLGVSGRIAVRIGVDSGPAVVGAGPADQLLVSGAAVNLAARLQQAAGPGEILAGETTRQLTASSVRFGEARSIRAKGFTDPVLVSPVEELTSRSARRVIPLVGRRHEVTMLRETLARVSETSRLHLVTVVGEPGIGKSRLVDEFLGLAGDEARVRRGRASRFEEDAPFAPVAEMIRREIGATGSTSLEEARALLEARVAAICRAEDVEVTTTRLGLILGIEAHEPADRRYRTALVRSALLTLLEGLATEGPMVLAFEDLELARPELLELIEGLAARGRRTPVMLLCVGRDEMLSMRPAWGGGIADSLTLRIESLPQSDAVALARASGASLDEETAERVARHAGGNPFFIVETTGMLLHEKADSTSPPLPPTVQAVVAARIDHLTPAARDVVRKASVFARSTFHTTELAVVAETNEDVLQSLEDEELFVRDAERPSVWRFNHEVVRDVAYESLPKRERRRLHLALADRLEAGGRYPAALAFHLERAARASLDLDPEDRSIAERAAEALLYAGDIARRRMELESAIDLYERALALGPPEHHWGDREARVLCGIGEASYWLGEFARAREALDRALRMRPDDDWTLSVAHRFLGDIALNIDNDLPAAAAHFDKALPAARRLPETDAHFAVARTMLMAGWVAYMSQDFDGARKTFEEALATARANPEGDAWAEARALTFVSNVMAVLEPLSEYRPLLEEALAIGRRMNDPFSTAVAEQHFANALGASGELEESLPHARAAAGVFSELGARWETASALGDLAELERLSGRPLEAEEHQRGAVNLPRPGRPAADRLDLRGTRALSPRAGTPPRGARCDRGGVLDRRREHRRVDPARDRVARDGRRRPRRRGVGRRTTARVRARRQPAERGCAFDLVRGAAARRGGGRRPRSRACGSRSSGGDRLEDVARRGPGAAVAAVNWKALGRARRIAPLGRVVRRRYVCVAPAHYNADTMRNTQRRGDIAVSQAIASFTRVGYDVSLPLTESAAYDLIVDTGVNLNRVQVRFTGSHQVDLRRIHSNSNGYVVKRTQPNAYDWLYVLNSKGEEFLLKECLHSRRSWNPDRRYLLGVPGDLEG